MSAYDPDTFHRCNGCGIRVSQTNECREVWGRCPNNPDRARCDHVSPSPWGPTQCVLPVGHLERHAYSPSETIADLATEETP